MLGKIINGILKPFDYKLIKSSSDYDTALYADGWEYLFKDLKKKGITCNVLLDLGANDGNWSKLFLKYYANSKVMLFEPQVEFWPQLERLSSQYLGSKFFPFGVGNQRETLILTIWDDLKGSSFLPEKDVDLIASGKQREIKVETIDYLLSNGSIQYPDFVKMDIQGFEIRALEGGDLLFETVEVFFIECSLQEADDTPGQPLVAEIIRYMDDKSFVPYDFPGFSRRPSDNAMAQCDICFVRKDSNLRVNHSWT